MHCTGIAPKQEKTHFQLYVPSENAHEKLVKTKLRSRCTISALGELCRDGLLHVCRVWALGVEVAHTWQEKLDFGKTYNRVTTVKKVNEECRGEKINVEMKSQVIFLKRS